MSNTLIELVRERMQAEGVEWWQVNERLDAMTNVELLQRISDIVSPALNLERPSWL
jgi:hypothetical protein